MFPRGSRISFATFLAVSVTLCLLGLFTLLLPLATTQAQTQPEALGSLRGVVRNNDGEPLPNITVVLRQVQFSGVNRQTTSNGAGVYAFPSLPSGTYSLHFTDPAKQYATRYYIAADFTDDATPVNINGDNVDNVNMEMAPAGAISLTLQSSSPVSMTYFTTKLYRQTQLGTWLTYRLLYPEVNQRHVLFDDLPAGNYRLCVTLHDQLTYRYATECYDQVVPENTEQLAPNATDITVKAGQQRLITLDFDDSSQVEGTVLSPSGAPLADIVMMLIEADGSSQSTTISDAAGRFRFPLVADGSYRLLYNVPYYATPNEYLPLYYPNTTSAFNAQTLEIRADTHISVTQQMRRSSQITGKVTMPGGVPLNNVYFSIFRQASDGTFIPYAECLYGCSPQETHDLVTGAYTITQLIPGSYRIGVNYYVPYGQSQHFQFYGGDSLDQADNITLGAGQTVNNINFVVGEGQFNGAITGRVTAEGQPVAGIEVGLFLPQYTQHESTQPHFSTRTDADGHYVLEGLTTGNYYVGARDPEARYATAFYGQGPVFQEGYPAMPIQGTLMWITGQETLENIDLTLTPGATIRGHVRVQGKTRGDYTVQAVPVNPNYNDPYNAFPVAYADVRTDATGFYEITGLISGTYYLRAYAPYVEGEYPGQPLFYPGTVFFPGSYDGNNPQTITVTTGQTQNNRNFWFYTTSTYYIPVIESSLATGDETEGGGAMFAGPPLPPIARP